MDFKAVLTKLAEDFQRNDIRYALMGAVALGVYGYVRGTVDIDFLVHSHDMDKVDSIMKEMDYECRYRTENVSQYISPLKVFGEVDFLHAFRTHSLSMLERAVEKRLFDEALVVRVLMAEDIIGLKLQAVRNDESRMALDMSDIESLLSAQQGRLDWNLLKEYFEIFEMHDIYEEFRGKFNDDQ
jgi:hypothetical protein